MIDKISRNCNLLNACGSIRNENEMSNDFDKVNNYQQHLVDLTSGEQEDDGTLAFLRIEEEDGATFFACDTIRITDVVGKRVKILNFTDNAKGKYKNPDGTYTKTIVKIEIEIDGKLCIRKFFTGCNTITYQMKKIRERNAFPRIATLKNNCGNFYFE